jgi:hypothetical protein
MQQPLQRRGRVPAAHAQLPEALQHQQVRQFRFRFLKQNSVTRELEKAGSFGYRSVFLHFTETSWLRSDFANSGTEFCFKYRALFLLNKMD